jgi:hypothetical protein
MISGVRGLGVDRKGPVSDILWSDIDRSSAQLKILAFSTSALGFGLAAASAAASRSLLGFFDLGPAVGAFVILIGGITMLFDIYIGSLLLKVSSILVGLLWLFCTLFGAGLPLSLLAFATHLRDHSFQASGLILILDAWLPLPCLLLLHMKSSDVRDRLHFAITEANDLKRRRLSD